MPFHYELFGKYENTGIWKCVESVWFPFHCEVAKGMMVAWNSWAKPQQMCLVPWLLCDYICLSFAGEGSQGWFTGHCCDNESCVQCLTSWTAYDTLTWGCAFPLTSVFKVMFISIIITIILERQIKGVFNEN